MVLMLGILIFFILRIINQTVVPKIEKNRIKQLFQVLEILIWVVYGFWGLHVTLKDSNYYMLAILTVSAVIVICLGWFMARDLIAGLVLRFGDNYQPGQNIILNEIKGSIVKAGYLDLFISVENGDIVKIPYSKISSAIHYKVKHRDKTTQHRFEIETKKNPFLEETRNRIKNAIMLSTGASIKMEPQISLMDHPDENIWKFEVVAYALSPEYFQLIERNAKNAVS